MAVYRRHLDAFALFAGSDFDIEAALSAAHSQLGELNLTRLSRFADLHPILAKKHYFTTGTLRWFTASLASPQGLIQSVERYAPAEGAAGQFLLAIPDDDVPPSKLAAHCREASAKAGPYPVALGIPPNAQHIRQAGSALLAVEGIRQGHAALEADAVARREIEARLAVAGTELEEALRQGFAQAVWYVRGAEHKVDNGQSLAQIASDLADKTFPEAPHIRSELVNRERPSSNSQGAVRALLHAMVNSPDRDDLGMEGFPAEMGLYRTVFKATGLHRKSNGAFGFHPPTTKNNANMQPMWKKAEELARQKDGTFPLSDLPWLSMSRGSSSLRSMTM